MDPVLTALLAVLVTILSYIVYQAWKVNQFWKERGIPYEKPWLFVGNQLETLMLKSSFGSLQKKITDKFPNEPVIGFYDCMSPMLLANDVDMIEKILIKDFIHFSDHGLSVNENRNPFESNLFTLNGKRWKAVRSKLSPVFTTGKLKTMYETLSENADELIKQLDTMKEAEMREMFGQFAMDVVGSCAFGISAGTLTNPDNQFRRMGKKAVRFGYIHVLKYFFNTKFPSLYKFLNIPFLDQDLVKYFTGVIKSTLKYRRETGYTRNDFVQMLMQIQDKGYFEMLTKDPDDDYLNIETTTRTTEKFELTNDQLSGHALAFLIASFEGVTVTLMYTLYELCKHPELQEKVREEVLREIKQTGSLSYDTIRRMNYMEQCIKEAMRKYPPTLGHLRVCTKEYILPNGTKIQPGLRVMIPLQSLHHNPKYYPEPEKYDPDRFGPDSTVPTCAYLPFGNGPRMCIAMRFAMIEMKCALSKLFMNYRFKVSPKTKEPLTLKIKTIFTEPNETLIFDCEKLNP